MDRQKEQENIGLWEVSAGVVFILLIGSFFHLSGNEKNDKYVKHIETAEN